MSFNNNNSNNYDIPYSNFDKPPIEEFGSEIENADKKKKTVIFIGVAVGVVILCVLLGVFFATLGKKNSEKNKTVIDTFNQISSVFEDENSDYSSTNDISVTDDTQKDNSYQSDVENINTIIVNFKNDQISYDFAISQLDKYAASDNEAVVSAHKNAVATIKNINAPRVLHSKGAACLDNGDYVGALETLNKIPKDYYKYNEVSRLIERAKKEYKDYTFAEVDKLLRKYDYDAAMATLDELRKYVNDADVAEKANQIINEQFNYDMNKWAEDLSKAVGEIKESEKETMETYKNEQKVFIYGKPQIKQEDRARYLYVDIKNASDQTTSKVIYSLLHYDQNGNPVKLQNGEETYINESVISHNLKLEPGETFIMSNSLVHISLYDSDTEYVSACIKEVVFDDGTRWINPYYLYWVEYYNSSYQNV